LKIEGNILSTEWVKFSLLVNTPVNNRFVILQNQTILQVNK